MSKSLQFLKQLSLSLLLVSYFPITAATETLSRSEAIHLLNRTGFGVDPQRITSLQKLTKEQAVDEILAGVKTRPETKLPEFRTVRTEQDQKLYKRDVQKLKDWQQGCPGFYAESADLGPCFCVQCCHPSSARYRDSR